jgi:hypothetical protein
MQSESVTKRSHSYDVWFAEERTWTARVTCLAPAELYPGDMGPFRIFDRLQKNLAFCIKMWPFCRKIYFYYEVIEKLIDRVEIQLDIHNDHW